MNPSERALRSRIAAHQSWANTADPKARTAPAREKFQQRFLDAVDPHRALPEAERLRRAKHARAAYFSKLQLKSVQARTRKGTGSTPAPHVAIATESPSPQGEISNVHSSEAS